MVYPQTLWSIPGSIGARLPGYETEKLDGLAENIWFPK
jgi:hypothetical protein